MLTVQHLSRLGPQGAIVSKGAGPPPLVTGRRVKPIIGEAWEIQYRVGRGRGLHHCGNELFASSQTASRLPKTNSVVFHHLFKAIRPLDLFCSDWPSLPSLPSSSCHVARPPTTLPPPNLLHSPNRWTLFETFICVGYISSIIKGYKNPLHKKDVISVKNLRFSLNLIQFDQ